MFIPQLLQEVISFCDLCKELYCYSLRHYSKKVRIAILSGLALLSVCFLILVFKDTATAGIIVTMAWRFWTSQQPKGLRQTLKQFLINDRRAFQAQKLLKEAKATKKDRNVS